MELFYVAFCAILIFFLYKKRTKKYRNLPPGPFALPIIGSTPFLKGKRNPVSGMVDESLYPYDKYFCTIWVGTRPWIWVQDFELTKELFAKEEFSARNSDWWYFKHIRGCYGKALGIVATSGRICHEQRRFALKHLKNLGFGKKSLDLVVQEEAKELICAILSKARKSENNNVLISDGFFNFPIINVLWQIVASEKLDPNNPENQKMMQMLNAYFRRGHRLVDLLFPIVRPFVPYDEGDKNVFDLKDTIRKQVSHHQNLLYEENEPKDFMDIYLNKIESEKKKYGSEYSHKVSDFHIEQLVSICLDFFQAGSDTTSTTLLWASMYLACNTEAQRNCQDEIHNLLGGKDIHN